MFLTDCIMSEILKFEFWDIYLFVKSLLLILRTCYNFGLSQARKSRNFRADEQLDKNEYKTIRLPVRSAHIFLGSSDSDLV